MKTGTELIADERTRQIEQEGFTAEHDDQYEDQQLIKAALCYLVYIIFDYFASESGFVKFYNYTWPWKPEWWKPDNKDDTRNLVKAGGLIAAEIDRLQRKD
jgi:hypothetical protein